MGNRLARVALPPMVLLILALSALLVLQARPGARPGPHPTPALGSPTLVFVVQPPADPQVVAARLAGQGAVAYVYVQVCSAAASTPATYILPLAVGQETAALARARRDPAVYQAVLSVWPCGAGL